MDQSNTAQITALLRQHAPLVLCSDCVAAKLGLPPKDVRDAAQGLVLRRGFQIVRRLCYTCCRTDDMVAFDGRGDGAYVAEPQASTIAKVLCMFCRTPILTTAGKTTVEGVPYHAGCWDRKTRSMNEKGPPKKPPTKL
jgi:hypothetical protein